MSPRVRDAVLSSAWFRWAQLGILTLFAGFQLVAYASSRPGAAPELARMLGPAGRLAYWHFFTVTRREHVAFRFEGFDGDAWTKLPMHEWFPARWESGYRWYALGGTRDVALPPLAKAHRSAIEQAFLQGACARAGLQRTRLLQLSWAKRLGLEQPAPSSPATTVVATRECRP